MARATRENVRRALEDFRARATKDDLLLVLLIGHGTGADDEAKFNLVGPDLSSREWAEMVKSIPGRLVFIDTASGSFPFLHLERKFMHLGFHVYDVGFQSPNVEAARPLVYATAMLLVFVILFLNLAAIRLRNRLQGKYRRLEA